MTISFVIYEVATGRIVRVGFCDEASLWFQPLEPGEAQMIGEADSRSDRVESGKIVKQQALEGN